MNPAPRLLTALLLGSLVAGCSVVDRSPVDPSALPGSKPVLTFDGRGNSPVTLRINGAVIRDFPCTVFEELTPGVDGVPRLPWNLELIRDRDGAVLLSEPVATMPKWILMMGDNTGMGVGPVLGPIGPSCAPS